MTGGGGVAPFDKICITTQDSEHGGGEVDNRHWDNNCRRGPTTLKINMSSNRSKADMVGIFIHEMVHVHQPHGVQETLDKQCWSASVTRWTVANSPCPGDPGFKEAHAELAAAAAVDAEDAFNEFDAQMAELCALKKTCDPEQGTKQAARDKLKKLCARLDKSCKKFDEAMKEFTTSYDHVEDEAGDPNAEENCRNENDELVVQITRTKVDNAGNAGVDVNMQINLDELKTMLEAYQNAKDNVNTPQPGETMSEKEKKKKTYNDLIDALGC